VEEDECDEEMDMESGKGEREHESAANVVGAEKEKHQPKHGKKRRRGRG